MIEIKSVDFFGLKISLFSRRQIEHTIIDTIGKKGKKIYYGYSIWTITSFRFMPELYTFSESFDIMVSDGRWFYWFAKLFRIPIQYELSIPQLSNLVLDIANQKGYSVMIIGSTEETNKLATLFLRNNYPNILVFDGCHGGNFSKNDQENTVKVINNVSPNILLIGVSSPKKEEFAYNWKKELNANIIIPFGGMIDGLAGKVKLVPPIIKKLGLGAWYRTFQEPGRMFKNRIYMATEFFLRILPITFFQVLVLRRKEFKIPSIYGIKKGNS